MQLVAGPEQIVQELLMVRVVMPRPYEDHCEACHRPVGECGELHKWGGVYFTDCLVCDECAGTLAMEE